MRTNEEIVERITKIDNDKSDIFGAQRERLVYRLPFDYAKPYLKEEVTEETWKYRGKDDESIKEDILDYMPFAWEKANDRRGLSASRSIDHMTGLLWLMGRDVAAKEIRDYTMYGKPQLRMICEEFGWNWREWDDGFWTHSEMNDGYGPPETIPPLP